MQVRCPHCGEVESYADDVAWRKIPCRSCNHGFTATTALVVGGRSEGAKAPPPGPPAASRPARSVSLIAIGALAVGNALFARAWLSTRHELRRLGDGLGELAPDAGSASSAEGEAGAAGTSGSARPGAQALGLPAVAGRTEGAAGTEGEADGADGARLVLELQRAMIEELDAKLRKTRTLLERAEKALEREDEAHAKTKGKLSGLLKENAALRREVDRYAREVRSLERRLERGR